MLTTGFNLLHLSLPKWVPLFILASSVYWSLQCLISALTQEGDGGHFLRLTCSVAQLCLTLCDPMDCSMPGFPVHHLPDCRCPAPVDPGNLKRGQSQSLGKDYLIRNIKRLGKNSVVGKLVEKRGWITWFMRKTNKTSRQEVCTIYIRPPAPTWITEGAPPWAPSCVGLRSPGK